ncbi:MAG: hypothetical protein EBS06_09555, partial [Proteobacteria bacterium]|nr:hypothetical protein [Pseudomonadota bacterium]
YQWQSSTDGTSWTNIIGSTSSTLLLTTSLVGKRVRATASYTDDLGTSENLTSTATNLIAGTNIVGSIVVAGSPIRNQVLTAVVTDIDGVSGAISYQWQSSTDGTSWTNIIGSTSSTLLLTTSLVGKRVRVIASYTDDLGTSENLTSTATSVITSTNTVGSIIVAGSAVRNQVLTAVVTDIDGVLGAISYQWQSSTNGTDWTNISGSTSSTLLLTTSLVGKRVRVTASYTDDLGTSESLTSTATNLIAGTNIVGSIVVAGSAVRNQVLTAVVTDVDDVSGAISYQWQSSTDGTNWTNISGSTSSTLLLTTSLVGKRVRVTASYTDDLGTSEALTSSATNLITSTNTVGSIIVAGSAV